MIKDMEEQRETERKTLLPDCFPFYLKRIRDFTEISNALVLMMYCLLFLTFSGVVETPDARNYN